MKTERSNVQIISNVYPVKVTGNRIDMQANTQFVSRIVDRDALRRLVDMIYPGLNYDKLRIRYAKTIPGISDWQANRIGIPDTCALAPSGEKPWGVLIVHGELKYVCKCEMRGCKKFNECRAGEISDVGED